jgi:hypothetical protein
MSNRPLTAAIGGLAASLTLLMPGPAQADAVETRSCVGTESSQTCVTRWRENVGNPHIIQVPALVSEQDIAESKERDRLWLARCQPEVRPDRYGVPRYVYSRPGCEFGS